MNSYEQESRKQTQSVLQSDESTWFVFLFSKLNINGKQNLSESLISAVYVYFFMGGLWYSLSRSRSKCDTKAPTAAERDTKANLCFPF